MGSHYLSKAVTTALCLGVLLCCHLFSTEASAFALRVVSGTVDADGDDKLSPTITVDEAKNLMSLVPAVEELRGKGMDVKWDVQAVPTMNNKDYYFFWIYNATAQKGLDIGSISVGNYAVNKHTADVRAWQVSHDVSFGDDGVLITVKELERLQEELRKKHGITSASIQEYRSAHLARRIIPHEQAQSAVRLPVTERSADTAEVSCWSGSDHLISRLGRSPIISSRVGYQAYAEVEAIAFKPKYQETYAGSLCENRVRLLLAKAGGSSFQILLDSNSPKGDCVIVEGAESCEVKGIQLVDWSRDGTFLLADLVQWVYESDALLVHVPIIYDVPNGKFIRPDVYHFFDEFYKTDFFKEKPDPAGSPCEFVLRAEGFSADGNLILSASRPSDDPTADEQVFCVDEKQTFLFDLGTNKINRLPSDYKVPRFGIRDSRGNREPSL
jgi:hypothetical protein